MGIALLSAMRSKDSNSQVGACIVSPENKILSLGYNGMPIGCNDDDMPWGAGGRPAGDQIHVCLPCGAERHPQLGPQQPQGRAGVCDAVPLQRVRQAIIQSGIKEIIYYSDKYHDEPLSVASRRLFNMTGVKYGPTTPPGGN